jgi:hypothetical protein
LGAGLKEFYNSTTANGDSSTGTDLDITCFPDPNLRHVLKHTKRSHLAPDFDNPAKRAKDTDLIRPNWAGSQNNKDSEKIDYEHKLRKYYVIL